MNKGCEMNKEQMTNLIIVDPDSIEFKKKAIA